MLEIQNQICIELLLALDRVNESVEQFQYVHNPLADTCPELHGGRSLLFSTFLSEEYDVDVLAAFLYAREVIQKVVGVRFKDLLYPLFNPETNETDASSALKVKQSPVVLPHWLRYIYDYTLMEAPLVACDIRTLTIIISKIFTGCPSSLKNYAVRKALFWTMVSTRARKSVFQTLQDLQNHIEFEKCTFKGLTVDDLVVVPVQIVLWMICHEFSVASRKVIPSQETDDGSGIVDINAITSRSLVELNTKYDSGSLLVREQAEKIKEVELSLAGIESEILRLKKKQRAIERKWKDYDPKIDISNGVQDMEPKDYDLNDLVKVKTMIADAELRRYVIQLSFNVLTRFTEALLIQC